MLKTLENTDFIAAIPSLTLSGLREFWYYSTVKVPRQEELRSIEEDYQKIEENMKQIIRYSHMEELTEELLDTFVKQIYVYKDKRVEIEWNFADEYRM